MKPTIFKSQGILRYSNYNEEFKLILEVDQGIVLFYRSLIPKYISINKQKYDPHISVVRKEIPINKNFWGLYEGKEIEFEYSNQIYHGKVYWWLNAFSKELENIRTELGLPVSSEFTRPPSEKYIKCFHITIGNMK
jgi:hypothetical protein